jgi:hypothetical protein
MSPETRAQAEAIWEEMLNKGGWFMRRSERKLREDAWWAHYLQARDTMWMNGQTFSWDHPWLVDMANRGVESTQFLYNNAERPAFARTGIGRVFSRFQMYTFNAVRFRKRLAAQADEMNYDPGTTEFKRLETMLQADLFMAGLASMVPWSLFGNALGPPLDQIKEMGQLFFGDEEEREQAFYGQDWGQLNFAKPLKVVQPPIARVPEAIFRSMLTRDWQRFSGYSIHQWFPFGRLGRDAALSVQRPSTMPERIFGVPAKTFERAQSNVPEGGSPVSRSSGPVDAAQMLGSGDEPATTQQLQNQIQ